MPGDQANPTDNRYSAVEARARLAAIVDSSDDAIISKNLDGVITSWNGSAERLFGYCAAEAIGQSITLIIPPERLNEEAEFIELLRRGERIAHFETERMRKDGSRVDISLSISPIKDEDGRVVGAAKVARDITGRKLAEQRLRISEARLRALLALVTDVPWTRDEIGAFIEPNLKWEAYTGQRWDEYRGFGWVQALHPDDRDLLLKVWQRACAERNIYEASGRLWHAPTEQYRYFIERATPVLNADGSIMEWVGANIDTEDQTRAELKIYSLLTQLKLADRRKDEFLATLSHELRGPLAPLRHSLEILKRKEGDFDLLRQSIAAMDRQLKQLMRLVDDLLDVSRITRGKVELRKERVLLASSIQCAIEACQPLIEDLKHELAISLPPEPIWVEADAARLIQIVGNLLTNACKYTKTHGRISVAAERQGSDVLVKVCDNGIGIPPDKLDCVFDMFAQIETAREWSQGGLGIGLMLVKRLIEMHGGSVEARSDGPGKGAEFRVRLPVLIGATAPKPSSPSAARAPSRGHRVLVVDDNRDCVASLATLLKLEGNEARVAHDGEEALAESESFRPDVVLLDIGLPRLNGHEVCRRIRQQSWGKKITLVALTGWGQPEDRERSAEAGFDHHLVKPVDVDALLTLISEPRQGRGNPQNQAQH
ncbi:MAG TPA: PAS domain S-box protein [Phycisphaerae bacterium]|nr:PAS domain S-box protein [Phycisphaerae bacterium]